MVVVVVGMEVCTDPTRWRCGSGGLSLVVVMVVLKAMGICLLLVVVDWFRWRLVIMIHKGGGRRSKAWQYTCRWWR